MFLQDWVQISTLILTLNWITFLLTLALLNILKALVIVKGRLKANISFWQSIGALSLVKIPYVLVIKFPFQGNLQVSSLIIIAQLWVRVIL